VVFPEITQRALKAHQEEGLVDMVIRRDNLKWQPQPVHRQPGSNLVLMMSKFTPHHIVKELARLEDRLLDKKRQCQGSQLHSTADRSGECSSLG
jgi:hypothetical protein